MNPRSLFVAGCVVSGLCAPVDAETVVEFYNASLDHYFITPLADEIAALDSGRIAGWTRTGFVFDAFAGSPGDGRPVSPVCRFYIPPAHGDSHFLSASPAECAAVLAKIPTDPNFSNYVEETAAEFYIALPDATTGACASGTLPVYRLWNHRADSNHRYTADAATRDAMIARGYVPEGYGPSGVAMCTIGAGVADSQVRVTGRSPFPAQCDNAPVTGVAYVGAEVEPQVAVDPRDPSHVVGVWQQDRWSDGGARGLRTGYSFDGGLSWSVTQAAFTHCTGGNAVNGGDFPRASDPWVTIGPDGVAYQIAIAFQGTTLAPGSSSAVLASRSTDGGRTWSDAVGLIRDGSNAFNDKESITADPSSAGRAYASWDRLEQNGHGPAYFSRTTDGGTTWEPARPIHDPGGHNQTLNNQVVVATSGPAAGTVFDFFTEFDFGSNNLVTHHLALVRSGDRGVTWSAAVVISDVRAVGTVDPQNPLREIRDAANLGSFAAGPNGVLVAVWQDARFSGGARDGIVFSRSSNGGTTWSTPTLVNAVPGVQALLPTVTVRADGTIGVLYYDLRNDTADPATLLADAWLATSTDGVSWVERHVSGPFDFNTAPIAEGGLFIGDYQALASAPGEFVAFFAQTNPDSDDRTDIVASVFRAAGESPASAPKSYRAIVATPSPMTPAWQARIGHSVTKTLRERRVGSPDDTVAPRPFAN